MNLELNNKTFIITGGGAGIGEAITLAAASEGGKVAIVGRTDIAGSALADKLHKMNASYLFVKTELSDMAQCQAAIENTVAKFGTVDVLVNNAGINDSVGLENGNPEKFIQSMHKNLFHYYYMAHYALPYLKQSKGNIINITSKTAVTGQGGTSGYAGAKGAQNALTREWAVELLPYGIRVNAVVPAEVYTPLYEKWISTFDNPEQKLKSITEKIPFENRFTTTEEIASAVIFLSSAKSSHTTGQIIYVDGGYTHLDRAL
ncbi:MAG: SDR family oxidoreductase [Cytophagales bacterium]|nr:SDR family oxidoreductase [Cytophagales bacterium]